MTNELKITLYDQTARMSRILADGGNIADYLAKLIHSDAARHGITGIEYSCHQRTNRTLSDSEAQDLEQ